MIVYDPSKLLKQIAPKSKIEKLLKTNLTVKKAALSFVDDVEFLDKKAVSRVALKTVKAYKARIRSADQGEKTEVREEILDDPRLLVQRVQNEIVTQISGEIKSTYHGEKYRWLPSDADEPDPEHQLNYGEIFTIGEGEMPGDRIGCKCGMEIITDDTELDLG